MPPHQRSEVLKILVQSNASLSQKRQLLADKGLQRSFIDSFEILADRGRRRLPLLLILLFIDSTIDADVDELLSRLERVSPQLMISVCQAAQDVKNTMHLSLATGATRTIYFHPLFMIRNPNHTFEGLCFEVVKRNQPHQKKPDTLAMGGQ